MNIFILFLLGLSTLLNVLVPISGSATVTPLIAAITDVHSAIGFVGFYFFLSAVLRFIFFYTDIQWPLVKKLLPISAVGSAVGALSLLAIPDMVLLGILAVLTLYFLMKKIFRPQAQRKENIFSRWGAVVVGLLSGFLQGTGLAGSDLRNNYLYANNLSIIQVHGTTAIVGGLNFFLATVIRLYLGKISFPDIGLLLTIVPFMIVGTILGRKVALKLSKKHEQWIVVLVMGVGLLLVLQKMFSV